MEKLKIGNKTISTPLIDIVKDLRSQLHNGKLETVQLLNDDIRVSCPNPNHKGGHESKASSGIYIGKPTEKLKYGTFNCFSCGTTCSFEHFVAMCFECSDESAKKWLIENCADDGEDYILDLPEIDISKPKKLYLDESILAEFQSYHPYMTQRKLSNRIIEVFKLKYDPKTKCIVFPVYDEHNKLYMLTRRSVYNKMFVIDKDKEKPLYLLNYIKEKNIQECIITEGQFDALTACTYGMPAVATMGALSDHQIDLINKSGIRILYSMFDNDKAGISFYNKLKKGLKKDILLINVPILILGKKDINDLSEEEFWNCIEKAKNNCII